MNGWQNLRMKWQNVGGSAITTNGGDDWVDLDISSAGQVLRVDAQDPALRQITIRFDRGASADTGDSRRRSIEIDGSLDLLILDSAGACSFELIRRATNVRHRISTVRVVGRGIDGPSIPLSISPPDWVENASFSEGSFSVDWATKAGRVEIHEARVASTGNPLPVELLTLSQRCVILGIQATSTELGSYVSVESRGTTVFGHVSRLSGDSSAGEHKAVFQGSGICKIASIPSDIEIILDGGTISLGSEADIQSALEISGSGTVSLHGAHEGHSFATSSNDVIYLRLRDGAVLTGASGTVAIEMEPGSICEGRADRPLILTRVALAADAQLHNADLFNLHLPDMLRLREAQRVSPYFPRQRRRISDRADQMRLASTPGGDDSQQKSFYWRELAEILKTKHAPGHAQSAARFQAYRARCKAKPVGAERLLLKLFGLAGFGELILRPLALYAVTSFVFGFVYSLNFWSRGILRTGPFPFDDRVVTIGSNFLHMLVAPLGILRATEAGQLPQAGALQLVTVDAQRIVGTFLIALTLLAIRRTTRAE
jgi:hypothetical protein